jgi:hypothetical protein
MPYLAEQNVLPDLVVYCRGGAARRFRDFAILDLAVLGAANVQIRTRTRLMERGMEHE